LLSVDLPSFDHTLNRVLLKTFKRHCTSAVGYLQLREWPSEVRFLVEPSILAYDGLFLAWTTRFPAGELSGITDTIVSVFEEAAAVYGLKLRPLV
jgi:hypothetical protein